jgi:hypothetical protein
MIDHRLPSLQHVEERSVKEIKVGDLIRPAYWSEYHKVLKVEWRDTTLKTVIDMQLEGVDHTCSFCFYEDVWTPVKRTN